MDHHIKAWFDYLRSHVLCRELLDDDFIFGLPSTHGKLDVTKPISADKVQELITKYVNLAGFRVPTGSFTTHTFRRGGAQYRFMYAPPKERWALGTIRWWGGWGPQEHVSFFLMYFIYIYVDKKALSVTP
jgi:hypothetical protein